MTFRTLIFDTETTDLIHNSVLPDSKQPRIIEFFGQVIDDDGVVVEELEFLCNPGHRLEKITTEITGLTDADLKGQLAFSAHEGKVRDLLSRCHAMVAHNLSYDLGMLQIELRRCGKIDQTAWPAEKICTVQETEWIKGHRLSLSALHEHLFGEPFAGAHRARVDVQALTRCFMELKQRGIL
jgi:DNA polymerase III epsilon subunit-like protein